LSRRTSAIDRKTETAHDPRLAKNRWFAVVKTLQFNKPIMWSPAKSAARLCVRGIIAGVRESD